MGISKVCFSTYFISLPALYEDKRFLETCVNFIPGFSSRLPTAFCTHKSEKSANPNSSRIINYVCWDAAGPSAKINTESLGSASSHTKSCLLIGDHWASSTHLQSLAYRPCSWRSKHLVCKKQTLKEAKWNYCRFHEGWWGIWVLSAQKGRLARTCQS